MTPDGVDNPPLTLTQKIVLAALAGALVGVVSALVWHNGTRFFNGSGGRRLQTPSPSGGVRTVTK